MKKLKIIFIAFAVIILGGGVAQLIRPSDEEAKKLGYQSAAQMKNLNDRGYKSFADYQSVKNFTVEKFKTDCKDAPVSSYNSNCKGKRISWTGVITGINTSDGARVSLHSDSPDQSNYLFAIESKSLNAKLSDKDVGKLVEFDGVIGPKNVFTPDIDGVTYFKLEEDLKFNERMVAVKKQKEDRLAKEAEAKEREETRQIEMHGYLKDVRWTKVHISGSVVDERGGVQIEKNWFSNDRIVIKDRRVSVSETASYIDSSAIKKIDDNIREFMAKEEGGGINFAVYKYHINCPSQTYTTKEKWWIEHKDAEVLESIDQKTGAAHRVTVPARIFVKTSPFVEKWGSINNSLFQKYNEAVCLGNLQVKTDVKNYNR